MSIQRLAAERLAFVTAGRLLARHIQTSAELRLADEDCGKPRKAKTPLGKLDDQWEGSKEKMEPQQMEQKDTTYDPFPGGKNPKTGEIGGPRGPEPTRYGDWERKGRVIDF